MALTFPRDMTSAYCWDICDFALQYRQEYSGTAGGDQQGKDLGSPVWGASYQTYAMTRSSAEALVADFMTLGGVLRSFYGHPSKRRYPGGLKTVSGLDFSAAAISEIRADRAAIKIDGLPIGLELLAGDFVSIETAAGTEFVQLARGGTVDGSGESPEMEIVPYARAIVAVNDTVTLVDPLIELKLVPNTLAISHDNRFWSRVAFQAGQIIR